MQKNNHKPVLVPSVYSARVVLWSAALVALFGALLWAYCAWSALVQARAKLGEPVQEIVQMPFYTVRLPLGWEVYGKDGNALAVFRAKGKDIPVIFCFAEQNAGFRYHALDVNPAIVFHLVEEDILAARLKGMPEALPMKVIGLERLTVRPGVNAVRMLFDIGNRDGEAVVFYAGDVRYVLWALWNDDDASAAADIHRFFRRLFEDFDIPEVRESIDRPVVDSGQFTAEANAAKLLQVERELALWRLFAARAEAEPETALVPALQHYREALRLLSSIRQESVALASDGFKLYQHLLEERRKDVTEWFVVLDKAVAMGDWDGARRQAKWIMSHATLTGERPDVRRAADVLATKIPPEEGESKKK